jgi:two-component sensor histidine kinase
MALIHEKLYQSTNLKKIDFGEYIHSLAIDIFDSYNIAPDRIKLVIDVEEIMLDILQFLLV